MNFLTLLSPVGRQRRRELHGSVKRRIERDRERRLRGHLREERGALLVVRIAARSQLAVGAMTTQAAGLNGIGIPPVMRAPAG
jgi:hypothetical protein